MISQGGCATIVSQQIIPTDTEPWSGRPFSGVEMRLDNLETNLSEPPSMSGVIGTPVIIADLVLSAAADTALLPFWAVDRALRADPDSGKDGSPPKQNAPSRFTESRNDDQNISGDYVATQKK
jgi:uncharacterized protein YceK